MSSEKNIYDVDKTMREMVIANKKMWASNEGDFKAMRQRSMVMTDKERKKGQLLSNKLIKVENKNRQHFKLMPDSKFKDNMLRPTPPPILPLPPPPPSHPPANPEAPKNEVAYPSISTKHSAGNDYFHDDITKALTGAGESRPAHFDGIAKEIVDKIYNEKAAKKEAKRKEKEANQERKERRKAERAAQREKRRVEKGMRLGLQTSIKLDQTFASRKASIETTIETPVQDLWATQRDKNPFKSQAPPPKPPPENALPPTELQAALGILPTNGEVNATNEKNAIQEVSINEPEVIESIANISINKPKVVLGVGDTKALHPGATTTQQEEETVCLTTKIISEKLSQRVNPSALEEFPKKTADVLIEARTQISVTSDPVKEMNSDLKNSLKGSGTLHVDSASPSRKPRRTSSTYTLTQSSTTGKIDLQENAKAIRTNTMWKDLSVLTKSLCKEDNVAKHPIASRLVEKIEKDIAASMASASPVIMQLLVRKRGMHAEEEDRKVPEVLHPALRELYSEHKSFFEEELKKLKEMSAIADVEAAAAVEAYALQRRNPTDGSHGLTESEIAEELSKWIKFPDLNHALNVGKGNTSIFDWIHGEMD